jgi:hypothetical protein
LENKEREERKKKETEEGDGREWKRRKTTESCYRCFFALALTRLSNTVLRIGVCAVWNGFMAV